MFFDGDNERYLRPPALFIYPGYQHQLRHYRSYLQWGTYGTLPYENGFGLFTPVARENGKERIVLHLSQANRFYLLESGTIIETLALRAIFPWMNGSERNWQRPSCGWMKRRSSAVCLAVRG